VGSRGAYYYDVDGSQIQLEPADQIAVDLDAARTAKLPRNVLDGIETKGRELRGGVVMLGAGDLSPDFVEALNEVGALQPVFGSGDGALVVVLPEVRIETADQSQATDLREWLRSADVDSEVVRDTGDRLVVRPTSGRGSDALDLANSIEEEVHPPVAQPRFLRVVPRPG
jgi:hypothetical protein